MAAIQTTAPVVLSVIERTPGDKQISVDPPEVTIGEGDCVDWDLQVGDRDRVTIEFEEVECATDCGDVRRKGPFEPSANNLAPGVLQREGPGHLVSSRANCKGRWKYTVTWRRPGWKVNVLDPYVIVRG